MGAQLVDRCWRQLDPVHPYALWRIGTAIRPVPMPNFNAAPVPASVARKFTAGSMTEGSNNSATGSRSDPLVEVGLGHAAEHAPPSASTASGFASDSEARHHCPQTPGPGPLEASAEGDLAAPALLRSSGTQPVAR